MSTNLPVWTVSNVAGYLNTGYWTASGAIVHALPDTFTYDASRLTAETMGFARTAISLWSEIAGVSAVERIGSAMLNFDDETPNQAATYSYWTYDGLVTSSSISIDKNWDLPGLGFNGYLYQTYVHEAGHAFGLGHGGPYNFSATYPNDALYANDSWQISVMSYFSAYDNTTVGADFGYVVTPMMADILSIRNLYGSTPTHARSGNTEYGFTGSDAALKAAGSVFSFSQYAQNNVPAMVIYDDGGNDALNASGYSAAQRIDLRPGAYSDIGGIKGNVGIYTTSMIERAIGGSGNDDITGNSADNKLIGNKGNDWIQGLNGNDAIDGGAGTDKMSGGAGNDTYYVDSIRDVVAEAVNAGTDTVRSGVSFTIGANVEKLYLSGSTAINGVGNGADNSLVGSNGANMLSGLGGNDILWGGAGNDRLVGGSGTDFLTGGSGNDRFEFDLSSHSGLTLDTRDRIMDFGRGDRIDVASIDADIGKAGDQAFVLDNGGAFSGGEIRQTLSGKNILIDFNTDADSAPEMSLLLMSHAKLGAADFYL